MEEISRNPTPVVNEESMKNFVNKNVVLYGKINSIKGDTIYLNINPTRDVDIMVKNCKNPKLKQGILIKVLGKMQQDTSLDYIESIQLDDNFDLVTFNELIPLMHNRNCSSFFY